MFNFAESWYQHHVDIDGQDILFHVFDTAGKVRSRTSAPLSLLFALVITFNCTNSLHGSFENLLAYQQAMSTSSSLWLIWISMDLQSYIILSWSYAFILCFIHNVALLSQSINCAKKTVYSTAVLCGELVRDSNANRRRGKGFE